MTYTVLHKEVTNIQQEGMTAMGIIYNFTLMQDTQQKPYYLALVKLDGGNIITARITEVEEPLRVGDRVEMVGRKLTTESRKGMIVYEYKFKNFDS